MKRIDAVAAAVSKVKEFGITVSLVRRGSDYNLLPITASVGRVGGPITD
jgi:hypothetical protein